MVQAANQGRGRAVKIQRIQAARVRRCKLARRGHEIRIIEGGKEFLAGNHHAVHGKFRQMVGGQVIKPYQHHRAPVREHKDQVTPLADNAGILQGKGQGQTPLGGGNYFHTLSGLRTGNFDLSHDDAS